VPEERATSRISILEGQVNQPASRREKIDVLTELAWEIRFSRPDQAYSLCNEAASLSQSGEFASQPYLQGLAASLVGQAFVDTYAGRLETAVSKCLQAVALLGEPRSYIGVRIWFTLGWTSFFIGDYPTALENGLKALELTRSIGDRLHEAWALDAVASFHCITGDFEMGIPLHAEAVKIFRSLQDVLGEMRALNNLAVGLLGMKEYDRAHIEGLRSFRIAKELEVEADFCNNACTLADILVEMGRLEEAEAYLKEALSSYNYESNIVRVSLLERVGNLRRMKDDLPGAETYFLQALELASDLDQRAEQAVCHQSLSDVYEKQGKYKDALENHKKYQALHNFIQGEQAAKRLAVLKITYQVESARHEAEIYRLKAMELEKKVDEQKVIQNVLELQSLIDPLTGLHNRRYFDDRFVSEYSRHSRSGAELSLLILDVDHFKAFNDTYGHVRGDECLRQVAKVIKEAMARPADVAVRYGGEEFVCLLPETDSGGALTVAEHIRWNVMELAIPHSVSSVSRYVTISIGVATTHCVKHGSPVDLIARADAQLYVAKSQGRNRVEADRN